MTTGFNFIKFIINVVIIRDVDLVWYDHLERKQSSSKGIKDSEPLCNVFLDRATPTRFSCTCQKARTTRRCQCFNGGIKCWIYYHKQVLTFLDCSNYSSIATRSTCTQVGLSARFNQPGVQTQPNVDTEPDVDTQSNLGWSAARSQALPGWDQLSNIVRVGGRGFRYPCG